jgi:hypothetical protein
MPVDYSRYPKNWLTEIRPRLLERANHKCEYEGCGLDNYQVVWRTIYHNRVTGWHNSLELALAGKYSVDWINGFYTPRIKDVKVILTVAHIDHDVHNHNVTDDRLIVLCQLHHLRYDAISKFFNRI